MNDDQQLERIKRLGDALWAAAWEQEYPTMGECFAAAILADLDAHLMDLVQARALMRGAVGKWVDCDSMRPRWAYSVITPKPKVVRAGYRKTEEGRWGPTCSEHSDVMGLWAVPKNVRGATHFKSEHANDTVIWDDPPEKIHVRLWWHGEDVAWSCTCVAGTFEQPDYVLRAVARHVDRYHPDADVTIDPLPEPPKEVHITFTRDDDLLTWRCSEDGDIQRMVADSERVLERARWHAAHAHAGDVVVYGELPEPPHKHHWVWNMGAVDCSCGSVFYPAKAFHGNPYTGPVPAEVGK